MPMSDRTLTLRSSSHRRPDLARTHDRHLIRMHRCGIFRRALEPNVVLRRNSHLFTDPAWPKL
jgi:hypothetical protein